ncbi:5780_t:CDS:2, partial [Cetraspora pellucida]
MKRAISLQKWLDKTLNDGDVSEIEYSYENRQEVGRGAFGVVYSALYDGKKFALKSFTDGVMNKETTDGINKEATDGMNKEATKGFIKEFKNLHAINSHPINSHPNINKFYGITRDPETNKFMLVLQFANGGNLRQYLKKKWNN